MNRNIGQWSLFKWALIALGWTFYGLFFASQSLGGQAYVGREVHFGGTIGRWLLCALLWFCVTPLVLILARKFPLDRQRWPKSLTVHLLVSLGLSVGLLFIYTGLVLFIFLSGQGPFFSGFRGLLVASMHSEVLTYWMIVGLTWALDYYRKYRERELRTSQLETKLAQAQLDALRMQLQPHFLFNTLNSISVLMADDVGAARRMLTRLSDLLRGSLANGGTHEVSLKEELEFLQNYVDIEQTRFQDRLTFDMKVQPAVLDAQVPNLILQPLVENAIRHGISPRGHDAVIRIWATREDRMVQLRVTDNGVGCSSDLARIFARGIGLSNTKERLNQLYGPDHRFEIATEAGKGFAVTIVIPLRNGEKQK